jgi:NADPH-dependent ferric siderophore reductase
MIGDETALPAIARRLEELPAGTRAVVLAEVDSAAEELAFHTEANLSITKRRRNPTAANQAASSSRPRRTASAGSARTMNAGFFMHTVSISSCVRPNAVM